MGLCLLAARAEGLIALDGVHMNLDDDEGFIHVCNQGRYLGFDGKTLIHPKTIDQANRIFSPQSEDINRAKRIIKAHNEAEMEGKGITILDGTLIEALHVSESKRLLALNEIISKKTNPEESDSTVID
jgi:citrate lyase subunit beta/citryl-CoA lyase